MTMHISYRVRLSEILFEELERHTFAAGSTMTLDLSELDAPDFPETVLGRSANSIRRIRLYGATRRAACARIAMASSREGS